MEIVRYGIIGCGAIGQRRHIPECAANPLSRVTAVVDVLPARVREIAGKYQAQAFTDYKKMLREADIDAVVVGTPNYLHARMALDAFAAGKHVLVEKPMAVTRKEGQAMLAAAKKARRYLMVGQNQRLAPPHVKAKEILDSGKLGKVLSFRTSFKHRGPDLWSVDGAKSWFFRKNEAIMGVTGDLGVHKADLMRWLLGEEFARVGGIITTRDKRTPDGKIIQLDDTACITLETRSGIVGTMEVSWTNYGQEDNMTLLYCQHGVMYIGTDREFQVIVQYGRNGNREQYKVGGIATNEKQTASGVIDSFTQCILNRKAPEIDGNEGYRSMDVILTAMEAAKKGKTLTIAR